VTSGVLAARAGIASPSLLWHECCGGYDNGVPRRKSAMLCSVVRHGRCAALRRQTKGGRCGGSGAHALEFLFEGAAAALLGLQLRRQVAHVHVERLDARCDGGEGEGEVCGETGLCVGGAACCGIKWHLSALLPSGKPS